MSNCNELPVAVPVNNEISNNSAEFFARYLNKHHVMLFFGIIILLIGLVGYLLISGAQSGSCDTEFSGGLVKSSTGNDNDGNTINTATEVVAEVFCIIFIIIGVGLCVNVLANYKVNNVLKLYKQYKAFLLLNNPEAVCDKKERLKVNEAQIISNKEIF